MSDAAHVTHEQTAVHTRGAIEAILMVVDEPVAAADIAAAIDIPEPEVIDHLNALRDEFANPDAPRGFELRQTDGRWRIYSSRLYADVVGQFIVEGQSARLSQAALETLAVVAYRQPVTRGQVSQVRGVNVDSVMKTLSARGLVTEVGESGGAVLYGTSVEFLERLGLQSIDDLPPLAPFLPDFADIDSEGR
jgi:segregation and condensation protein B